MNDVERELRELLERKAGSVGGVAPRLPEAVRKRGRRRQAGTAMVGVFTVVAVALVSFAGLRSIDRGGVNERVPGDSGVAYEVFERIATVGSFTISSPSDWYLIRPSSGMCGSDWECTILQLTNFDPGTSDPVCGSGLPTDGVALVLTFAPSHHRDEDFPAWPGTSEDQSEAACGPGRYLRFADEGNFAPHIAWIGSGPDAADEDVSAIQRSFDRMTVEDTGLVATGDAAYVIAGGENAAGPWRLELRASTSNGPDANVDLRLVTSEGDGPRVADVTVPGTTPVEESGGDPTFGAVTKEAVGVELRLEEDTPPIPATVVPLPPSLAYPFDLFFASNDADVPATAFALDANGEPIGGYGPMPEGSTRYGLNVLGQEISLEIDHASDPACYRVLVDTATLEGCIDQISLQSLPLPSGTGQVLVFSINGVHLSGLELDVDGGETLSAVACKGSVCVMGIPTGSGTGTLWLLQKGERVDSDAVAWTQEGIERS